MSIRCGKYKHFKGNEYTVYGEATTLTGEKFVLYRQDYGDRCFWIRPVSMFFDKLSYDGKENVSRFTLITKLHTATQISAFASIAKKQSLAITHSETRNKYRLVSVDESTKQIILAPSHTYSSYLTDSQLAFRMGYDLYNINGKAIVNKTCFDLLDTQRLQLTTSDSESLDFKTQNIIKKQMNACSIDLHISDDFYKPKRKKIDMANATHYSVMPQQPWKKVPLRDIGGKKCVVLHPGHTLVTYTQEKICLPADCAGKVEIKSTYARLSLSVTASDFCNPGWRGHFPLTITNNGRHVIVLHPREKMLQLSLVPTEAPIIHSYSQKGVFMDDDGTPFRFWRSQTVKLMEADLDPDTLLTFCENVLLEISVASEDVESEQKRFHESFLRFCQKKLQKEKYANIKDKKKKLHKLWDAYKQREKNLRFFFSKPVKFSVPATAIIAAVLPTLMEWSKNDVFPKNMIGWLIAAAIFSACFVVLLFFITPCYYCTFEKLEFNKIFNKDNPNINGTFQQ